MIAQFALRLIIGMSLMWAIMPRKDVTSGFFRIQMLVTLGLGVLAALTVGQLRAEHIMGEAAAVRWLAVAAAVCSFLGSVLWTLERRSGGAVTGLLVLGLCTAALLVSLPRPEPATAGLVVLAALSELSAASMVGGFVSAMLLGHWYLTAPTMTIRPLSRLNRFLAVFTACRGGVSLAGLMLGGELLSDQLTYWMWLTLRWGAGILGPALLVFMVGRILRYRNTQSATGVLFVGVILTFIGELSAIQLTAELRIPF